MFHTKEVRDLFDMKVFVDTDADTRLARRCAQVDSQAGVNQSPLIFFCPLSE